MNTGTLSARVDHHAVCGCGCVLRVRMCWHQTQICQAQHNTDMGNEKGGHSFEHELFVLRVSLSTSVSRFWFCLLLCVLALSTSPAHGAPLILSPTTLKP